MSEISTPARTPADLAIGALVAVLGLVVLGHAVVATTVSVLFMGWLLFAGGVITLVGTLFRIGRAGFWAGALGGGLLTVMGLVFLRHTTAAALTLTLVAGAIFLMSGLARLVAGLGSEEGRVALILAGAVSTVLGLVVLFNVFSASYTLLGVLLGLETLAEGIAIMLVGREGRVVRVRAPGEAPATSG